MGLLDFNEWFVRTVLDGPVRSILADNWQKLIWYGAFLILIIMILLQQEFFTWGMIVFLSLYSVIMGIYRTIKRV